MSHEEITADEAQLVAAAADEMPREAPLEIVLRPSSAFALAALLQLALKHPGVQLQESSARTATLFIEVVRHYFAGAPAVLELLRRGDQDQSVAPHQGARVDAAVTPEDQ